MNEENKTVTVSFGGFDDTPDNTIQLQGPISVSKSVANVNDLLTIDMTKYEENSSVIVFVKNVNKSSAQIGEIPYRGAFYRYNWTAHNWEQVVIGNHSHSNMQLLDQLGEINTSTLKVGDRKVLTIEKLGNNYTSPVQTPDYKVAFVDQKELPEIPADVVGKDLYLTADAKGKFQWTNNFAPAQTFKVFQLVVDANNKVSDKELRLSNEYLLNNSIFYNEDLGDTFLVFDTGSLVPDIATYKDDEYLYIKVNNTIASQTFDLGETIVFMIVRNGISGIIDTFEKQYMTKQEAVDLLTNGAISLNGYVTKDLLSKYSLSNHYHPEYIKKTDYDIFDWRYADYQHVHSEYMTEAQVLSIISYIAENDADENGNINANNVLTQTITSFETEFNNKLREYITSAQVSTLLNNLKTELGSSDNIIVPYQSKTLTEVLHSIDNKLATTGSTKADDVLLNDIKVNLGDDSATIGGLSNGDVINKNTSLSTLIQKIVTKEVKPDMTKPELQVVYVVEDNTAGICSAITITPKFIQNSGGKLSKITIKMYKKDEISDDDEPYLESIVEDGKPFKTTQFMNAYNDKGDCFNIIISADYEDGKVYTSNIGKEYQTTAGTTITNILIKNERKPIFGSMQRFINNDLTGNDIYEVENSTQYNTIYTYDITDDEYLHGFEMFFDKSTLAKSIIFAIPETYKYSIKRIIYENQHFDITDDFNCELIEIPDESGNIDNNINNLFTVYHYSLNQTIKAGMSFKLMFSKRGE